MSPQTPSPTATSFWRTHSLSVSVSVSVFPDSFSDGNKFECVLLLECVLF